MKKTWVVAMTMLLCGGTVVAQQDLVAEGQRLMKANGRNMGTVLNVTAKGEKPYDQAAIDAALKQLDETAKRLPTLYLDVTKGMKPEGDYVISPKVYEDRASWNEAIATFDKAVSDARTSVKDLDSLKPAVSAISKQCSNCHEMFRMRGS